VRRRADTLAVLLSLLGFLAAWLVAVRVFEAMPHIEDEMAYAWQAEVMAAGKLTLPSPAAPKAFLVPFVVDYQGQRFGKYPPGWPATLAIGAFFGLRALVNPLLAALGIWLTYRLGKKLFSETVGLLAAALTLTSPFFLMNSGSLLSHPLGLLLSAAFALAWLDTWRSDKTPESPAVNGAGFRSWLPLLVCAFSLGLLVITRPLTALGVSLPFGIHGLFLLIKGNRQTRLRLLVFAAIVLALCGLLFLWQYAVTGDALLNPYSLWWEYDKVGFGPGHGHTSGGHTWQRARINTNFSLKVGRHDLFGWGGYSWVFLPFGLLALLWQRNWKALMMAAVFPSLVFVYLFYWIGSHLYGPRYFYEGLFSLILLSAVGIAWLAGWPVRSDSTFRRSHGWWMLRPLGMTVLVSLLLGINLFFYLPARLGGMHGLYGISRERFIPFQTEQAIALQPALVVVHPGTWTEYGGLLDLQTPFLDTPFLFVIHIGENTNALLAEAYPERTMVHYYPDEPFVFYKAGQ